MLLYSSSFSFSFFYFLFFFFSCFASFLMLLSFLFFSFLLCAPALPTSHLLLNWASQSSFGRPGPPPDAPKPPANIHSDATSFSSSEHSFFNLVFFFLYLSIFFSFFFFSTNSTLLYLLQFHSLQRFSLSSSSAQLPPCLSCRLASLSLSFVFFSFLPACLPACRLLDLYRYSGGWLSPAICCRVLLCFTSFLRLLACQFSFNPLGHPFRFLFFISEHLSSSLFRCSCPSLKLTGVFYHPHLCQTPLNLPSASRSQDSRSVDFEIRPLAPSLTFFFFPQFPSCQFVLSVENRFLVPTPVA